MQGAYNSESDDERCQFPTFTEAVRKHANWDELKTKKNHQFLFDINAPHSLPPYPLIFSDKWDSDHVRMPFSPSNILKKKGASSSGPGFKTQIVDGVKRLVGYEKGSPEPKPEPVQKGRWTEVLDGIGNLEGFDRVAIFSADDLLKNIQKYNPQVKDVTLLESYFRQNPEKKPRFFNRILPKMRKMVANADKVLTQAPQLLKKLHTQGERTIWMTQEQCAHLLVLSFFCCWPKRSGKRSARNKEDEYDRFNEINFTRFFSLQPSPSCFAKLECIIEYFNSVTKEMPKGVISFKRTYEEQIPNLDDPDIEFADAKWMPCHIKGKGLIEDEGDKFIQADFANKFIGGGTLGRGCVQEEIRFMICPELIITQLLCEEMQKEEAIIVTGVQRFSNYSGYADSFRFEGSYNDPLAVSYKRDCYGRIPTEVFAIDAVNYVYPYRGDTPHDQFSATSIKRDILKAYSAFKGCTPATIATGNWGCGAFGGDPELKFVIQMIAAAFAQRPLWYFCFDDLMTRSDAKLSSTLAEIKCSIEKKSIPYVFELLTEFEPGREKFSEYLKKNDPEPTPGTDYTMSIIPFPTYYDACPKTSDWEKVLETDQVLFDVTSVGKDRILPSKKTFNGEYSKDDFVDMPFSDHSYWQTIKTKICDAQFENLSQLETAITSYNKSVRSLKCLNAFFQNISRRAVFFLRIASSENAENRAKGTEYSHRSALSPQNRDEQIYLDDAGAMRYCLGRNNIQLDFADEFIGGLTLRWDTLQEEIRFLISPELTVAQLFFERMSDSEAIIITGSERFSRYSGYSQSFRFRGNFVDTQPRDGYGRKGTQILAIDAVNYGYGDHGRSQFDEESIRRDILKAFIGFKGCVPATIATGKWGCGAFGGNVQFKFAIQLIAAALASRPLQFFSFDKECSYEDNPLSSTLESIARMFRTLTIDEAYQVLLTFKPRENTFAEHLQKCTEI
ncbi:Oidioi.mRNA.OKI2018_I69.PAR.g12562.t1.cds [Oikopleura dioica]|uniref:poly(ADP-ribose) glycohydrolase n=1 Tax=Oikopleura dioica TaxID=34765 RepID=A0ABN7S5E1_OIKDI|nr:Oidioi.mRNA.OKI2018_I69.PAR.g12562.t1.cds [Oikopleura dioica]